MKLPHGQLEDFLHNHFLHNQWIVRRGRVYAAAIVGVSGQSPRCGVTSVDPAEAQSDFATSAFAEAERDPELTGFVGQ
jgi:hypothetical protein